MEASNSVCFRCECEKLASLSGLTECLLEGKEESPEGFGFFIKGHLLESSKLVIQLVLYKLYDL